MTAVEKYYFDQAGGSPYFIGRSQRGHGIGSLFAGLFRTAVPLITPLLKRGLKAGGKAIGRAVLKRVVRKIGESDPRPVKRARKRIIISGNKKRKKRVTIRKPPYSII